jgi:hypothetical protein
VPNAAASVMPSLTGYRAQRTCYDQLHAPWSVARIFRGRDQTRRHRAPRRARLLRQFLCDDGPLPRPAVWSVPEHQDRPHAARHAGLAAEVLARPFMRPRAKRREWSQVWRLRPSTETLWRVVETSQGARRRCGRRDVAAGAHELGRLDQAQREGAVDPPLTSGMRNSPCSRGRTCSCSSAAARACCAPLLEGARRRRGRAEGAGRSRLRRPTRWPWARCTRAGAFQPRA